MPQRQKIPKKIKAILWELYCSAYQKAKATDVHPISIMLAKESINAILQYDNYPMAVNLADHAEDRSEVWHDYNWCLQEEYYKHISNVYTAKPFGSPL